MSSKPNGFVKAGLSNIDSTFILSIIEKDELANEDMQMIVEADKKTYR